MKQIALDIGLDLGQSLENFFAGPNEAAYQHLCLWVGHEAAQRRSPVPVYLWGPQGSGKSHLLHAAVAALREPGATRGGRESGTAPAPAHRRPAHCLGPSCGPIFARYHKRRSKVGLCLNSGPALLPATQMGMSAVLPGLLVPEAPAKVTIDALIMATGNYGTRRTLLKAPVQGEPLPDSDDELGGPSRDMSRDMSTLLKAPVQ